MTFSRNLSGNRNVHALAVGHVTHDRYADRIAPGGCAFYASRTFHALGAETDLFTAVGHDFRCRQEMSDGIRVYGPTCSHTTVFTNKYPSGEARQQWIEHKAMRLHHPEEAIGGEYDIVFLAPVFGELEPDEWAKRFQKRRTIVGLGLQGLMKGRADGPRDSLGRSRVVPVSFKPTSDLLAEVDVVFLSAEDIRWCGDENLLPALLEIVPMVVVTQAEHGSVLYLPKTTVQVGVAKAHRVVDPTGAGDTYSAAFLYFLAQTQDPVSAGKCAAAAASIAVEGEGGACLHRLFESIDRAAGVPAIVCPHLS